MLTIFTCPKPFTDPHIALIQRNAIRSWKLLRPEPEILLCGDEAGVAATAEELGVKHLPGIEKNEFGTPLVSSLFKVAQEAARHQILCYVNADIIFMEDFSAAAKKAVRFDRHFLMCGRRWNIDLGSPLRFDSDWGRALRLLVDEKGCKGPPDAIDYFIFHKNLWREIPPFALGRFCWDNWLLYKARKVKARLIDASEVVFPIHQNHPYSCAGGMDSLRKGPEAQANLRLMGGPKNGFTLLDASHRLARDGFALWLPGYLRVHSRYAWIWYQALALTHSFRHRLKIGRVLNRALGGS